MRRAGSSLALTGVVLIAACQAGADSPSGPGLEVRVAPLSLPGVTNARYRLAIVNGSDEPVVDLDLTADRYGDGSGSITYVAPCDASDNDNTVTLTLLALYEGAAGTTELAADTYVNPGPIAQTVTCRENADTFVGFDLTIARDAQQGFFDVAVSFEDVFCSAKLDCLAGDLLFNGATRDTTLVLGFACTAGDATSDTWQYLDDVVITCAEGSVTVDTSAGPGVLPASALAITGTSPLFSAAIYRGEESLLGVDKQYWNVALGFAGGTSCLLETRGTASDGALAGNATPANTVWPYIDWSVNLTDGGGAASCGQEALGGAGCPASGACVTYTSATSAVSFAHVFHAEGGVTPTCDPACVNGTCVGADVCDCQLGWTGATCATNVDECNPDPCQHGGTCVDGLNSFTCDCTGTGFVGDVCQTNVDDCPAINPCQHGGTCVDGLNAYTCSCTADYTGPLCATPTNNDPFVSNVSLLIHGDGANGSTSILDSSTYAHTLTRLGQVQLSQNASQFGVSSIYFDGAGDLLTTGASAALAFGTGNFTVETWYRRASRPHPYPRVWQFGPSGTGGWNTTQHWSLADGHQDFAPNKFVLHVFAYNGNASPLLVPTSSISADVWYHLAVTREGNTWRLFINGVLEASTTWAGQPDNGVSNVFVMGGANYQNNDFANGYLDEVRITKGVARYTADFTPPTMAFPNP